MVGISNERLTKAIVFGWYEGLYGKVKKKGMKRETGQIWSGCVATEMDGSNV